MTDDTLTAAPAASTAAPAATDMKSTAVPSIRQQPQAAPAQEAPATTEGESGSEAEHEEEASAASEGNDAPDGARKSKGVGKRINELTREKYTYMREAEELRRRVAELEGGAQRQPQQASAEPNDGRPTREQFDFDEDAYIEALTDWKVKRAVGDTAQKTAGEAKAKVVEERIAKFAEANPEAWHEAITAPVTYTETMLAAVAESDVMPQIGVYLAQHLDEAHAISQKSPVEQIKAIARIEDGIRAQSSAPAAAATTARVDPPKKLTNTPPPPKTLQGAAPAEKSLDDMSTEERIAHWRAKRATR